ncbi:LOW QUALITY PROTEIN: prokineticin Bm8-d-like [Penaeus monodon]|uniref:LOW QUALITY PROTEIN: prokineticin Bm8-d-like n=1 Tax=Penaeus monodon TaxID=6687 RepID=UPI0018A7DE00|nr:LOW QUALITY PROTEIN: prokineticin Bm8-d-like [Penaeus monodon]
MVYQNTQGRKVAILLMAMATLTAHMAEAVPKRVANRMVPSWWTTVRNVCWSAADCNGDECCARPMLSANAYCMPLRTRGQVCDASPLMLSITSGVYFSDCPCHDNLTCAALSNNSKSQCVDLRSLEIDYRRLAGLHNLLSGENN